jgi:hypothetical protein
MSLDWLEYKAARRLALADEPFYGLIAAAMMRADTTNARKLRAAFPDVWEMTQARYDGPMGYVKSDSDELIRNTAGEYAEQIIAQLEGVRP